MIGDGNGYQPTPTGAIHHWFQVTSAMPTFQDRVFIDIGAGKGKVLKEWRKLLRQAGLDQELVGIESSLDLTEPLTATALSAGADLIIGRAEEVDYSWFGKPLLCWLFNPFDTDTVKQMAVQMRPVDVWMVMNSAEHATALLEWGWHLLDLTYGGTAANSWFLLTNREIPDE